MHSGITPAARRGPTVNLCRARRPDGKNFQPRNKNKNKGADAGGGGGGDGDGDEGGVVILRFRHVTEAAGQ